MANELKQILGSSLEVTTPVSISNGGTGQAAKTSAFNALSPNTTKGDISIHDGIDNIRLPVGADDARLVTDSSTASGLRYQDNNFAEISNLTFPIASQPYFLPSLGHTPTATNVWDSIVVLPLSNANISSVSNGEIIVGETGLYDIYLSVTMGSDSTLNIRSYWGYTVNQPLTPRAAVDVNIMCAEYITDTQEPVSMSNLNRAISLAAGDRITLWYLQSSTVDVNIGSINFSIKKL